MLYTLQGRLMRNDSSKRARTQVTKMAGFLGSYVFSPRESNIDPVGTLMRKQPSGVFELKTSDMLKLMTRFNMSSAQARSYLSSVTQIPKARYISGGIYEDTYEADSIMLDNFMSDPELARMEAAEFNRIRWFDNSWVGHGWANSLKSGSPAPPCFWTKTYESLNDPISRAWIEYEKLYPGRGWRVSYENNASLNHVYDRLLDFLDEYPSGEVHVWIQGNLNGMGPTTTMEQLREKLKTEMDLSRKDSDHTDESFQLQYFDGDEVLLSPNNPYFLIDNDYTPFENKDMWFEFIASDVKLFMKEHPMAVILSTQCFEILEKYPDIIDGVVHISGNPIYRSMEGRRARAFMEKNNVALYSSFDEIKDPGFYITLHSKEKDGFILDYETSGVSRIHKHIHQYWTSGLLDSTDPYYRYSGVPLQRIPIIPWRITNFGYRIFGDGLLPQMFPSTKIGIEAQKLDTQTRYLNYNGYVKLRKPFSGERFDFVWVGDNMNGYHMEYQDVAMEDGRVIGNPEIFMGLGSVVTSVHSIMKFKRDEISKLTQVAREIAGHEKVSGHMFAGVLAFQSHLLWYLQEVFINSQTKQSIYLFNFTAEKLNRYHTIGEYTATIHDIEAYIAMTPTPAYVRDNISLCREVVSKLQA